MSITHTPTWKKLEDRWSLGFETLLPEEQEALALWWLEAETMNGSLSQFFWNTSGDLALIALSGLKSLSMPITQQALESALAFFGPDYPLERDARMAVLEKIEEEHGEEVFTPASDIISALPEDFVQAAVDRLEKCYAGG